MDRRFIENCLPSTVLVPFQSGWTMVEMCCRSVSTAYVLKVMHGPTSVDRDNYRPKSVLGPRQNGPNFTKGV
jgi:hypothetical protein